MNQYAKAALSKVPEVTLGFWIIKILATTIGETGGDAVTMSLFHADKDAHNGGYLIGTGLFMVMFVACVIVQVAMKAFRPPVYWLTIVATTTVGTAMADFADRSLGFGYAGGSALLLSLLMASLLIWRWAEGTVSVNSIVTPRAEAFYWTTILFSQTLGTALGDWMADTNGLGFGNASLVFAAGLMILAAAYFFTNVSRVLLFWAAFILTRPLGATLGDLFDKPIDHGGFAFSRTVATTILIAVMVALILVIPQRPGFHPGAPAQGGAGGMNERPRMAQRGVPALLRIGCLGARAAVPDREALRCAAMLSTPARRWLIVLLLRRHISSATGQRPVEFGFTPAHTMFLAWCGSFTGSMNPDCVAKSVRIRHRITSASFLTAIDATPANIASRIRPQHTI